ACASELSILPAPGRGSRTAAPVVVEIGVGRELLRLAVREDLAQLDLVAQRLAHEGRRVHAAQLERRLALREPQGAEPQHALRGAAHDLDRVAGRVQQLAPPADHERSEEHTSELQSRANLVSRLLLETRKGR